MLLFYALDNEQPDKAVLYINCSKKAVALKRNNQDKIVLPDISENILEICRKNLQTDSQSKEFNYKIKLLLKRYSPALIPYLKEGFTPLDSFMIKERNFGKLYILMKYIAEEPEQPIIYYDKGNHAIFLHSPKELPYTRLHPQGH